METVIKQRTPDQRRISTALQERHSAKEQEILLREKALESSEADLARRLDYSDVVSLYVYASLDAVGSK